MSLGLVGRKVGMTRIFAEDGRSIPVTVLDVSDNRVSQIKTLTKPVAGHLAKAGVESCSVLREFRVDVAKLAELKAGDALSVELFSVGQMVDVTGTSIGKGFAGSIKRHNFSSNRESHGNSVTTRAPGSIGMAQDPGRVFPGKRMAGHLGDARTTQQNLEVVRVDVGRQLLLVKGAVPGSKGSDVIVRPAVKAGA